MNAEFLFEQTAHSCLIIYILALGMLLFHLRSKVHNQTSQFIYATLWFWFALAFKDVAYFCDGIWYDTRVSYILMSIDLWPTPLMAMILLSVLQPKWLNLQRISYMIAPFLMFTLLNIIFQGNESIFIANQVYGFLFATLFGVIIFILTFKCDLYLNANYSNKLKINIIWVRYLIALMYAICVMWVFLSIDSTWLGDAAYYLSTTVLVCLLFNFTLSHKKVLFPNYMRTSSILTIKEDDLSDCDSTLIMDKFSDIEAKLDIAINQDKVYLNPHLTITDLAMHIGTNRTYLSRYINNYKAIPFVNYINNYRCEEALRMLQNHDSASTMIEISDSCGFASYSTFRRVFKHKYGCSPSECRK